jgi:biofilm PGA synthesis lipoprotein PgaB
MQLLPLLLLLALPVHAEEPALQVLSYHDVKDYVAGDYDPDQYAVSTSNLIAQFTFLRDNGFHPVSVDDVIAAYEGQRALPENAVLLTFDDGMKSFYTRVYPLLKLFKYPAVISVVTSWIESDVELDYAGKTRVSGDFLTWDQLREMQASGLVEVASHSHDLHKGIRGNPQHNTQPAATTRLFDGENYETEAAYTARIERDLEQSVNSLQNELDRPPRVMTWPFGALNDDSTAVARKLGMHINLTLAPETTVRNGSLRLGRNMLVANPTLDYFSAELLQKQPQRIFRVAQVDLDYVYDPDPEQQRRNLDRLLDRIKAMEISHVFLQAFADDDGDGGADEVYFPNRHLPVRADLFNRVAWQLRTRADVRVFAWLPMLSFVGDAFEPEWRVMQQRNGVTAPDPVSEPRLSPFSPDARKLISEVYEDLAIHAKFDGLLFHDDGRLNEFEDFSPPALDALVEAFGEPVTPAALEEDEELARRWSTLKSESLLAFSLELAETVRHYQPDIKTARNIFASALLDDQADVYLAQDYDRFLETYDIVALMAMPGLEAREDEKDFYEDLVARVSASPEGLGRTIFQLQTVDWSNSLPLDSRDLRQRFRWLQSLGVRHLGYYPDDFVMGHPKLDDVRLGMSLANEYGEVLP